MVEAHRESALGEGHTGDDSVVFSCRNRRVPIALTPARDLTFPIQEGLEVVAHGWSEPEEIVWLRRGLRTCEFQSED